MKPIENNADFQAVYPGRIACTVLRDGECWEPSVVRTPGDRFTRLMCEKHAQWWAEYSGSPVIPWDAPSDETGNEETGDIEGMEGYSGALQSWIAQDLRDREAGLR